MFKRQGGLVLLEDDRYFQHLDIKASIERYGNIRLHKQGREWHGPCPFPDCGTRRDGFWCWDDMTWPVEHWQRFIHWKCRGCNRSGRLEHLVMALEGVTFWEACELLAIPEVLPEHYLERKASTPVVQDWQKIELAFLDFMYPLAQRDLLRHSRARAYLQARGIPLEVAKKYLIGYLVPYDELSQRTQEQLQVRFQQHLLDLYPVEKYPDFKHEKAQLRGMRRWFDRIIYPMGVDKRGTVGYGGRAVSLWTPGMDEYGHKAALEAFNERMKREHGEKASSYQIRRYLKTYQSGFFNADCLREADNPIFVEGFFDALALLAAGLEHVVDIGGIENFKATASRVIPASVSGATLAYDSGKDAVRAMEEAFNYCRFKLGFVPEKCLMPDDGMGSDWNERYRKHGRDGIACLLGSQQATEEASLIVMEYNPNRNEIDVGTIASSSQTDAAISCFACQRQLAEAEYESNWWLTDGGLEFCSRCWKERHIEHAAKALTWLADRGLPTSLDARIAAFLVGPSCALCGGHNWTIDELTGALVCPCVARGRSGMAQGL